MANIVYRFRKRLSSKQLDNLFHGYDSNRKPPQALQTLACSTQVITAWDNGKLVGAATANDGPAAVTLGWIYVRISHRKKGIGSGLISGILKKFPKAHRVKLVANRSALSFYEACGFYVRKDAVPMIKELK